MDGGLLLTTALTALFLALLVLAWWRLRRVAFWTCLASLLVASLLAEGILRRLELGVPGRPEWLESLRQGSPSESAYWPGTELVYSYPSDPRGYFDADGRVIGRINSLGLRGAECSRAPLPGRERIALVGDSFTLGIGVRDEDTLPARLEQCLGPQRFEVLNFGVSGTDTLQQVDYLEGFVLGFEPRMVVVVFFLNDTERRSTIRYLSKPRAFVALRRHSYLLNLTVGHLERILFREEMLENYREGYEQGNPAWIAARQALTHARDLLAGRGIELVVAIHPVLVDLQRGRYPFAGIHATISAFCTEQGIPVVDLYDSLADQDASTLWVHPNDQHPNERANRLSAQFLATALRGLLGSR